MLMSSSRNIVLHRKSSFHSTRKRVGFTPQFITKKEKQQHLGKLTINLQNIAGLKAGKKEDMAEEQIWLESRDGDTIIQTGPGTAIVERSAGLKQE